MTGTPLALSPFNITPEGHQLNHMNYQPIFRNAGRFALAASIVATLLTAFAVVTRHKHEKEQDAVRPTWDEDMLGI